MFQFGAHVYLNGEQQTGTYHHTPLGEKGIRPTADPGGFRIVQFDRSWNVLTDDSYEIYHDYDKGGEVTAEPLLSESLDRLATIEGTECLPSAGASVHVLTCWRGRCSAATSSIGRGRCCATNRCSTRKARRASDAPGGAGRR